MEGLTGWSLEGLAIPTAELTLLAQIVLIAFAATAGKIAYDQVAVYRFFELLKFVDDDRNRNARQIVYREISVKPEGEAWWQDDRLEQAAARVCATYDVVGSTLSFGMIDHQVGRLFIARWGVGIVQTHRALASYLEFRRKTNPTTSWGFTKLYERATRAHPKVQPPFSLPDRGGTVPRG